MRTITITDAVEAAARAQYERAAHPGAPRWEDCAESDRAVYRHAVRPHVEAAAPFIAARSLQDAATAFATTRPSEAARRSLDHPVVELQAMAYRHTAAQRPVAVPSSSATVTAPAPATAPRRVRAVLGALHPSRRPEAV
jgi:hypothetical protein